MSEENVTDSFGDEVSGKYLSFSLANEQYAVDILKVVEIFGMCNITRVPKCPEYVKGVINLRGRIIPVVDLRSKFGLQDRDYDGRTCIIVVSTILKGTDITLGIIVDTVLEVRDFDSENISSPPNYGNEVESHFILGMGRYDEERVAILLDLDKIFNDTEASFLSEQAVEHGVGATAQK